MTDWSPETRAAAITLVGVVFTALISLLNVVLQLRAKRDLDSVNDAVNNRHKKYGSGAPKIYDLAVDNNAAIALIKRDTTRLLEWQEGYLNGPLDTGDKVREFVAGTQVHFDTLDQRLGTLDQKIDALGCPLRGSQQYHHECKPPPQRKTDSDT